MPQPKYFVWRFSAIGTEWSIETIDPVSPSLSDTITSTIEDFDATYSRFREDSLITKISRSAGTYRFPESAIELFALYQQLYDATNGSVTPLVGSLLESLGYDAKYSLRKKSFQPTVFALEILEWDGLDLTVSQPVLIDIGAVGKGYLVDRVAQLLDDEHSAYVIDASGDIRTKGETPQRIGLEDPLDEGKVLGVLTVQNASLCGSATNRRAWGDGLHHIVDPMSGKSTSGVAATWVKAETTAIADGLATALFFTEPDALRALFNFEYICFYDNRSMRYSEGMKEVTQ